MLLALDRRRAAPIIEALWASRKLEKEDLRKLSGAPIIDLLLDISYRQRFDDPEKMVAFARAACGVGDKLSTRRYGKEVTADLRARAWIELANAYLVADRLNEVGPALARARELMAKGTQDPELLARFSIILGYHFRESRCFQEAQVHLEGAAELYSELGLHEESLRVRLGVAQVLSQAYETERAALAYLRALLEMEPDNPDRLIAVHGLILNLAEMGEPAAANTVLKRNRWLYRRSGRLTQYRLFWLEGKIAKGLGQFGTAEAKLNTAWLAFLRVGKVYDSALVALDLAWVYAWQRRHQELVWLVDSLVRVFQSSGFAREALASLALLKKSGQEQKSTEALCAQIDVLVRVVEESPQTLKRGTSR